MLVTEMVKYVANKFSLQHPSLITMQLNFAQGVFNDHFKDLLQTRQYTRRFRFCVSEDLTIQCYDFLSGNMYDDAS